jgi:segregation and condensation protein B
MSGDEKHPSVAKAHDATADTPEEVLLSRLESMIFVYPEPITVRRLARVLSVKGKRVRELVGKLAEHYQDRGIIIEEVAAGFQFRTHPDNADVVRAAIKARPIRLSRPALETLAIVAYRQPATRAEVEDVRRVDCGATIRYLFEKGLIRVLGRKEEPGRPIIYGTSAAFLELFGLKALDDLPSLREFSELWQEHQELVDEMDEDQDEMDEPMAGETETEQE